MANLKKKTGAGLVIAVVVLMTLGISFAQSPYLAAGRALWEIASLAMTELIKGMASEYGKSWADEMLRGSRVESSPFPPKPRLSEEYPPSPADTPDSDLPWEMGSGLPLQGTLLFARSSCGIRPAQVIQLNLRVITIDSTSTPFNMTSTIFIKDANDSKSDHMRFAHSSPAVGSLTVWPERSAAKSKARKPANIALFDFAARAATLRANGQKRTSTREELSQCRVV